MGEGEGVLEEAGKGRAVDRGQGLPQHIGVKTGSMADKKLMADESGNSQPHYLGEKVFTGNSETGKAGAGCNVGSSRRRLCLGTRCHLGRGPRLCQSMEGCSPDLEETRRPGRGLQSPATSFAAVAPLWLYNGSSIC